MKKIIIVFIASFLLALGLFLGVQYYLTTHSQKGALQVTSSPRSKVYINETYLGQTPLCKCEAADMLQAGEYTIRLVPTDSSLQEFQEKITISQGVLTVVDRKFGKNAQSEGSIISLTPLDDKKKTEMLVVSFPQGASVLLDGQAIGKTPILYDNPTESDHIIQVGKDGYSEKEVRIRTPLGFKLTVAAYLGASTSDLTIKTASPSSSPDGTTGTPTPAKQRVTILQTPTGFLRVRDNPSVTGAEVGRVTPGKTYVLNSEEGNWYEIIMDNNSKGWISTDYAQKEE
jgi:hypothetical protein